MSKRIFVGRNPDNEIHLEDRTISGIHAVILRKEKRFLLQDAGSRNGTFLNGQAVQGRVPIREGDTIRFGRVEVTFQVG